MVRHLGESGGWRDEFSRSKGTNNAQLALCHGSSCRVGAREGSPGGGDSAGQLRGPGDLLLSSMRIGLKGHCHGNGLHSLRNQRGYFRSPRCPGPGCPDQAEAADDPNQIEK